MIHKKYKIGKHTPILVEFGTGDILIQNAFDIKEKAEYIYFLQAEPGPIGEEREGWNFAGKTTDAIPEIVVGLKFTKPESIDVLIESLKKAKEELHKILNELPHFEQVTEKKEGWRVGDQFTTPETGDKIFTVNNVFAYDVEAIDGRSRSGTTMFTKSYIKRI